MLRVPRYNKMQVDRVCNLLEKCSLQFCVLLSLQVHLLMWGPKAGVKVDWEGASMGEIER